MEKFFGSPEVSVSAESTVHYFVRSSFDVHGEKEERKTEDEKAESFFLSLCAQHDSVFDFTSQPKLPRTGVSQKAKC